jgi:hypothetical protein
MTAPFIGLSRLDESRETWVAKRAKKMAKRREWTKEDVKALRAHSRARTPVPVIAREQKRTVGAIRQKALSLGIGVGHRR